ncbi:LexA repressor [compost metagenome]
MSKADKRRTDTSLRILEFLRQHIGEKGYSPTIAEIGDAVGLRSSSTTHGYIKRLQDAGLVTFTEGTARSIRLVEETEQVAIEQLRAENKRLRALLEGNGETFD